MPATAPAEKDMVQIALPENVEIKALVEYVSKRLGVNILYDENVGRKRVTISSPTKIPKDSLMGLLQSVLKMSGLALVDAGQKGWKKIVQNQDLVSATDRFERGQFNPGDNESTAVLTQVFDFKHVSAQTVDQTLRAFLSKPGGNSLVLQDQNLLIVTDFAGSLKRIAQLIDLLDQPRAKVNVRFVDLKNSEATDMARQVGDLLHQQDQLAGGGRSSDRRVTITTEPRTNRLVVISSKEDVDEVLKLVETLDVPIAAETHSYRLKYASPQRIDQLAKDAAGPDQMRARYKSVQVPESGLLIVTAPASVHKQVETLIRELDVPAAQAEQSNVRFYKLTNATAASVLSTIHSLESGGKGFASISQAFTPAIETAPNGGKYTGTNNPPPPPGQESPPPPFYQPTTGPAAKPSESASSALTSVKTKDAIVTADQNTNTIIVIAPPETQNVYRQLISILDKRRPQVLIEVTLVTLDISNTLSLGVEMSRPDSRHNQELVYTSFGLSKVDPLTGTLAPTGGLGFNGAIIRPDELDVIVQAVATSGNSKVLSIPKVLVNDNATATLTSVNEAPFTSVNASQTVSSTSFAGYTSAGTTITVTPHISEGDHLQLQYSVTLSSFSGNGANGVPPPRQTSAVNSEITVSNGFTAIVGGLAKTDQSETVTKLPFLGDIPLAGYLFSTHSNTDDKSRFFVFLRPIILRDDEFEDLKYFSEKDLKLAKLPAEFPQSQPRVMP